MGGEVNKKPRTLPWGKWRHVSKSVRALLLLATRGLFRFRNQHVVVDDDGGARPSCDEVPLDDMFFLLGVREPLIDGIFRFILSSEVVDGEDFDLLWLGDVVGGVVIRGGVRARVTLVGVLFYDLSTPCRRRKEGEGSEDEGGDDHQEGQGLSSCDGFVEFDEGFRVNLQWVHVFWLVFVEGPWSG